MFFRFYILKVAILCLIFSSTNGTNNDSIFYSLKPEINPDWRLDEIPELRIVGGTEARKNEFPTIVNLLITRMNNSTGVRGTGLCGGNIIDPHWILTAAHCVYTPGSTVESITVVAGDHFRNQNDGSEQLVIGETVIRHASYSSTTNGNDIALIKLRTPLRINQYVQIASVSDPTYPGAGGTPAQIAGWGRLASNSSSTNELRKANVTLFTNTVCADRYKNVGNARILSNMICAGAAGRGGCNGDSGGPLYCSGGSRGELFVCGLTSFGVAGQCGSDYYPTVYTRVSSFVSWIRQSVPSLKTSDTWVTPPVTTRRPNNDSNVLLANVIVVLLTILLTIVKYY